MLFFEGRFLLFLAVVLLLGASLLRGVRARVWLLLVASYVFYAAWDPRFLLLIFASTALDFWAARAMVGKAKAQRRPYLWLSLCANLGCLAVFKYADFGITSLNALLGVDLDLLTWTLPVGISFFTFQSMSYTIDVYHGELEPDTDFATFALFVSFFPQLVAGPIIRASTFLVQVRTALSGWCHQVLRAAPLFALGLFKKVVIADHLARVVNTVYADPSAFNSADRWLATLAFSGQIYCDFSGYTDMALALCLLFGFQFPDNFRSPYLALGPRDFWRRWHISLSTWLRDYLYIPLGGSRGGPVRTYVALFLTMLLGGLWHGAAWTFVLWGAFHGLLLVVERRFVPERPARHWSTLLRFPVFFLLTLIGWLLFRAQTMTTLVDMLDGLWRWSTPEAISPVIVGVGMAFIFAEHAFSEWHRKRGFGPHSTWGELALAGALLPLTFLLRPDAQSDFIYFQF